MPQELMRQPDGTCEAFANILFIKAALERKNERFQDVRTVAEDEFNIIGNR